MYCALLHGAGFEFVYEKIGRLLHALIITISYDPLWQSVYRLVQFIAVPMGNCHTVLACIMGALPPCRMSALVLLIRLCPPLATDYLPYRGPQIHNIPRPHTCYCFCSQSQAMLILQCWNIVAWDEIRKLRQDLEMNRVCSAMEVSLLP